MGGIFLTNYFIKLLGSFIMGYLFIKWFPNVEENSEVIIQLVLNPVQFFAASTAFMIGLMLQGSLLKIELYSIFLLFSGKLHKGLYMIPIHVAMIYLLTFFGIWQAMIFSISAAIYGIISIDFHRQGGRHA